ncbi:prenyltransferase/squalene oxidase repeat-containing protein [Lentzea tibetensis]|uniref:prenyltransferase/squalene oxidase repeat-containing protein n=1 Tax=Lentzea tibetensis TaxID=2591470 RepID=UPI001646AFD8|nr:prenyltransferase/squalene oxidase repeat-containing protein [Lentzea tibetensis]
MDDLVTRVAGDPFGQVSPSVYETARLVALAPWLEGHATRVRFLVSAQNPDGTWGAPDGYGLVPTLSATEALLDLEPRVAERGLAALHRSTPVPDTIAHELIIPWLVGELNARIGSRLHCPVDDRVHTILRDMVRSGRSIPEKVWHSLEAFGADARRAASVTPSGGLVCGSPAATAAWLGEPGGHEVLHQLQKRNGGPVPGVAPITVFEPAWVAVMLADAGMADRVPASLVAAVRRGFTAHGAPAGPGLPADSDDTAAALSALARLGQPGDPSALWNYEQDDYFVCFPQELTPSISTNAHILDALGEYAHGQPRFHAAIDKITRYLVATQAADGSWLDKWHASPYYATTCCAQALARVSGAAAQPMVRRAVDWVLDTQRDDGSWGRWTGTVEETAYAVQLLLLCGGPEMAGAAERAGEFLRETDDAFPPLWHDKDLYTPIDVVRAARLAARRLIATSAHRTSMVG